VAEALGDVAELAGRYDDSLTAYTSARRFLRSGATSAHAAAAEPTAGRGLSLGRVARKTGIVCERAGRYRDALAWYARGRRQLETATGREAEALRIRLDLGRYSACVAGALPAAERAERAEERALLAHAYYLLHAAFGDLGSPEVDRYRSLALPIYTELGDLVGQGNVLNNLGIEAYFEGRWDDALALYARSKEAKSRAGDVANAATQSNNEAEILSDQGRFAEAEALLRDALRVWSAAGYEIGIALATSNLGRAAARAGRHAEGLSILDEAVARFERIGAAGYVDETTARIAECLVLAGRADEARATARETLERVRAETVTSVLESQLERTLGWCELLRGDEAAAEGRLLTSLAVARALGAAFEVALTQRARLRLQSLPEDERRDALLEATSVLSGLGVIAVAEPELPA
jgi:tetratricopeptide (TPR) repeat protein